MNHIRNGYFAKYFKSFSFIPTLFITSILTTIFIGSDIYGIIGGIKNQTFNNYLIAYISYFSVLYLIFAFSKVKYKDLSVADNVNLAIGLTALFYITYTLFISQNFTLFRFIIPAIAIFISVFLTVMRTIYFNPYDNKGKVYYTKHNVNAYYHTLLKNYSFFGVILFSLGLTCLSYLIIYNKFTVNFNSTSVIAPVVLAGIFFSFLFFNSVSKKIGMFDFSILSLTMALIPSLLQILLLVKNEELKTTYIIYWAIFCAIAVIITLIRYIFFDISKIEKSTTDNLKGNRFVQYFKKLSLKYGISVIFTISFMTVIFLVLTLTFAPLKNFYKIEAGELLIHINIVPALITNLLLIGSIILGIIYSATSVKSGKIIFGDFIIFFFMIFSITATLVLGLKSFFDFRFFAFIGLFTYSVILLILRIIRVCPKNIDEI